MTFSKFRFQICVYTEEIHKKTIIQKQRGIFLLGTGIKREVTLRNTNSYQSGSCSIPQKVFLVLLNLDIHSGIQRCHNWSLSSQNIPSPHISGPLCSDYVLSVPKIAKNEYFPSVRSSVPLDVRMKLLASHWTDFFKFISE